MRINNAGIEIGDYLLQPAQILLAAGQGNAELMALWGMEQPRMQTRPLQMVMMKGDLPAVYAHCLGASSNPRLTVTSYPVGDGHVWYLGGQLAEAGINRSKTEQIDYAKSELKKLLPWMNFTEMEWATLCIDRAEVQTPGGRRPHDSYLGGDDNVMVAWPTKLAFAPRLAEQVLLRLESLSIQPARKDLSPPDLPKPPLAALPWEKVVTWN
jgi:hypothetical protein